MSCSGQQKKYLAKKTVAIFAGAMMLFAMTFSLFYLAIETHHHCEDENCPICECLRLCKNIIQQNDFANKTKVVSFLQILPVVFLIDFFLYETPVSKKIRLNN
ncbi:MAG: hypothetical protein K5751_05820 [Treponemataceae bacterium]|nr:hypothetical protein [Treponemataceae bacterium]